MKERRMVVEGFRLVRELLAADLPVEALFFTSQYLDTQQYQTLSQFPYTNSYEVTKLVFDKMADTETPQGVIALCEIPQIPVAATRPQLFLIADQVRDPGNMGTILRTAWAAGVTAVFLLPGTIDYTNPKVVRAGMGAHFHIPIIKENWETVKSVINGTHVWVAEADMGRPYDEVNWNTDITLVIGGEAAGAQTSTCSIASSVHIPMQSATESINAAVACGVILFEAARQRRAGD
jgi:TrmH family RNA methyltransferase